MKNALPVSFYFCLVLVPVSLLSSPKAFARYDFQERPALTEVKRQAADALNQGAEAFRNGQYDEAIKAFTRAKQLDPSLLVARLYLATAYASQYIPGAQDEDNVRMAEKAVEEYRELLALEPNNLSAIDGLGAILFNMAGTPFNPDLFKESKSYHRRHIEFKPDDPEPYFWIGVIDWTLAYRVNIEVRTRLVKNAPREPLRETDPLPPDLRAEYSHNYGPTIDEGIQSLKKAIELRPDYDDAMAYLSLMYRRKADTVATAREREQMARTADGLLDRVKEIKGKRASQQQ